MDTHVWPKDSHHLHSTPQWAVAYLAKNWTSWKAWCCFWSYPQVWTIQQIVSLISIFLSETSSDDERKWGDAIIFAFPTGHQHCPAVSRMIPFAQKEVMRLGGASLEFLALLIESTIVSSEIIESNCDLFMILQCVAKQWFRLIDTTWNNGPGNDCWVRVLHTKLSIQKIKLDRKTCGHLKNNLEAHIIMDQWNSQGWVFLLE